MLLFLLILVLLHGLVDAGTCPIGSVDYVEAGECIITIAAMATLQTANRTCAALSGRLIQPQTQQENLLAVIAMRRANVSVPATIGVIQPEYQYGRVYADGTPLQYRNFYSESEYSSSDGCTMLNGQTLAWYATPCNDAHPFVCQFSDLNTELLCPVGWTYNDFTKNCYYIQKISPGNRYMSLNQTGAEAICVKMGAHLASIHTDRENTWMRNFIATSANVDCTTGQALIGASCIEGKKTWTDGSTFDFDLTRDDCSPAYTMINDYHCGADLREFWPSWYARNEFSRFICQKPGLHLPDVAAKLVENFGNAL